MSIISPITGVKKSKEPPVKTVNKPKVKKVKKDNDELIPIISPFFGPAEDIKEMPTIKTEKKEEILEEAEEKISVDENLKKYCSYC